MLIFEDIITLDNLETTFLELSYNSKSFNTYSQKLNLEKIYNDLNSGKFTFEKPKNFVQNADNKRKHYYFGGVEQLVSKLIYNYLNEIIEPTYIENLFSNRKGKSHKHAVFNLQKNMQNMPNGVVLRMDIEKYYDTISHEILLVQLQKYLDKKLLELINKLLKVMNKFDKGIVSGSSLSNLFGNLYLSEIDIFVFKNMKQLSYIRFVDDMSVVCKNTMEAASLKDILEGFLAQKLGLKLSSKKTFIRYISEGCVFLGYKIFADKLLALDEYKISVNKDINDILCGKSNLSTVQIKNKIKAIKSKLKNTNETQVFDQISKIDEILKNGGKFMSKMPINKEVESQEIVVKLDKNHEQNMHENIIIQEIKLLNLLNLTPWDAMIKIKQWKDSISS
ncbi:MAG: RNA-dependent DNA polymerase [Candidatus Improbicoccus devescovinae]|nr:MAG: RNA-dependent DNA polymerase [Candidatus Improbicoccus devescovinae]